MAEVIETKLPGIGVRYDFRSASGTPVGVLVHRSGRRAGVESDLIALAGAYVLILAIAGPVLTRFSDHITLPASR